MYLKTQRTIIRDFYMADVPALQEIFGDAQTMQYLEPPYDIEKTEKFIREFCIEKSGAFAIVDQADGKLMGYLLFHLYDGESETYEIGWVFHKAYWRQGYAYESCVRMISHAFSEMSVRKILAETIDPMKSVGLMEKLGMKLERIEKQKTKDLDGNWTDLYCYSLSKEEYQAKNNKEGRNDGSKSRNGILRLFQKSGRCRNPACSDGK